MAAVLYVAAVAFRLARRGRFARTAWTAACILYLTHVAAAFQFSYHWNHAAAYRETARQTAEVFGMDWGGGLYFNYLFTVVWIADVVFWRRWPQWVTVAIQTFLAFMFFNATVVFAVGWTRWLGVAATVALLALWLHRRRRDRLSRV